MWSYDIHYMKASILLLFHLPVSTEFQFQLSGVGKLVNPSWCFYINTEAAVNHACITPHTSFPYGGEDNILGATSTKDFSPLLGIEQLSCELGGELCILDG